MTDYTPTTETVRDAYVRQLRQAVIGSGSEHEAEFDRWLETMRHDAWQIGFETSDESSPYRDNPHTAHPLGPQDGDNT